MTSVCPSQSNKDTLAEHLVKELHEERTALWSMYCQMATLKPFEDNTDVRSMLSRFSQLLMDYVSLGHFGIYERLMTCGQQKALDSANRLYPAFSNTTDFVLSFNDCYDDGKRRFRTEHLSEDLSALGETLAQRMELEDHLCSLLLH